MAKPTFYNLPEEKRLRITSAARCEFASVGYDLASIQTIIGNANIPRGSFYQYFEDKRDLFLTILSSIRDEKLDYLGSVLSEWERLPLFDLLGRLIEAGLEYAKAFPDALQIAAKLMKSSMIELEEVLTTLSVDNQGTPVTGTHDFYMRLIEHAKDVGEITSEIPTATIAFYLQTMMESISRLVLNEDGLQGIPPVYDDIFLMMKNGLINDRDD